MPKVTAPAAMSKLSVYADGYLGSYVSAGSVVMLDVCSVCACVCVGECRHMYVVWGACEPVCPLNAYVIGGEEGYMLWPIHVLFSSSCSSGRRH